MNKQHLHCLNHLQWLLRLQSDWLLLKPERLREWRGCAIEGLGGGNATSRLAASELEATRGVSFRVSGLVNPGAGSTEPFVIQTTFNDATNVIDEARVAGVGIATGMFPARQVTLKSVRAGQANAVDVSVTTAGLIPDNAQLQLVVPNGLGLSQPLPTQVIVHNRECQWFL